MSRLAWILCIYASASAGAAYGADTKPQAKVIDLGQLSLQGELRRPSIQWLDSKKQVRKALPSLVREELESFEKTLLAPEPVRKEAPGA